MPQELKEGFNMAHVEHTEHSEPQDAENEADGPEGIENAAEPVTAQQTDVVEAGMAEEPPPEPPDVDDQAPPTQQPPRRRRRWVLVSVAIVILGLVGGGGATAYYVLYVWLSSTPEYTARFLPSSTAIYMSINLRPGVGQLNQARKIIARFRENLEFQDRLDDSTDDIEDESGIQFFDDILPWLGPELSLGIMDLDDIEDFDSGLPDTVMFLQTSDPDATEDFVRTLMDYFEDEYGEETDRGRSHGFPTYSSVDEYSGTEMHFAVTDEYMVFATSDRLLDRTLDRMETPSRSLAENEEFIRMQDLAGDRFAFLYIDAESIARDVRSALRDYDLDFWDQLEDELPETISTAASFVDMGINLTTTYGIPGSAFSISGTNSLASVDYLPADTLAFMSFTGVAEIWDEARDSIEDVFDSTLDFRRALPDFERDSGIDIDRDIFGWMTGEVSLALLPSEFYADRFGDIDEFLIHAVAQIEFERLTDAEDGLDQVIDSLEDEGVRFDDVDIGDDVALLADLSRDYDIYDYEPGFLMLRDRVLFGTTRDSLEDVMDIRDGKRSSLGDDEEYRKALDALGGATDVILYLNIAEIVELVLDASGSSIRDDYEDEMAAFVDPISVFAAGYHVDGETVTSTMVITFD